MEKIINILLVEDHALVAEAWSTILTSVENYKIVGIANNADQAFEMCIANRPDVVLMDVNLKNSNGFDATEKITNSLPKTRVIGLSMHSDVSVVKKILSVGARGYLSKDANKSELVEAITKVMEDETYISKEIKDKFFNSMMTLGNDTSKKELSIKEIEIVRLIAKGLTSKEIADKLFLSPRTVETHRYNILKKLELPNAAQLSSWAMEKGYI